MLNYFTNNDQSYPYTGSRESYHISDNGVYIWINEDVTLEPYSHQDYDFTKLCNSHSCRCKQ